MMMLIAGGKSDMKKEKMVRFRQMPAFVLLKTYIYLWKLACAPLWDLIYLYVSALFFSFVLLCTFRHIFLVYLGFT